jgi:hypothetical protein
MRCLRTQVAIELIIGKGIEIYDFRVLILDFRFDYRLTNTNFAFVSKIVFFYIKNHCCPIKVNKKEAIKMASRLKS